MAYGGYLVSCIALLLAIVSPEHQAASFVPSIHRTSSRRQCPSTALDAINGGCHTYHDRRSLFQRLFLVSTSILTPSPSKAQDSSIPTVSTNPFAELEALLPVVRVKTLIDRTVELATDLTNIKDSSPQSLNNKKVLVQELEDLILRPQNFTRQAQIADVPRQPAQQYLDSYRRNLNRLSLIEKPGALLVQSGEIDAWKRLKRQERARESENEIRAAFNAYTSNLSFSADSYRLNVPQQERSKMIREDRLPDVKSVIASDMGMRYLYRNQVLTAMDDARAELQFQIQQQNSVDATDLLELLRDAQKACNSWFSLIDETDVRKAQIVVQQEETKG